MNRIDRGKQLLAQGKRNMIGSCVMQLRRERGVRRIELLEKLQREGIEMSVRSLELLEQQKRRVRDYELIALSKNLEVSVDYLMDCEQ